MPKLRQRVIPQRVPKEFMEELVKERGKLRTYARYLTRNGDAADDLVQDTFVKAAEGYASFEPGTNLSAWVFRIMRNEFISDMRRSGRRQNVPIDSAIAETVSHQPNIEEHIRAEKMLLCLACLERNQCDSLIAAAYLGMDYETIAQLTNVSVGTVKSRVSRARDELEELMNGVIQSVDIGWFQKATVGIPKNHWYYAIAKAYEDLFADVRPPNTVNGVHDTKKVSKEDQAWNDLVASGALDAQEEEMPSFLS